MTNFTAERNIFRAWYEKEFVSVVNFPMQDNCTRGEFSLNLKLKFKVIHK